MNQTPKPLVAVDIGNSRIKLGLFEHSGQDALPGPARSIGVSSPDDVATISHWLGRPATECRWFVASVNRPNAAALTHWLARENAETRLLAWTDLPVRVELDHPERVGIDRLANAVAANRLRQPSRPAIVVDLGTAITVDLVSASGSFRGGAILPGIGTSARALGEFTDLLPRLDFDELDEPPPALGTNTDAAIRSGLFWGAVGAIRELVRQLSADQKGVQVFMTGGASPAVAGLLDSDSAAAQFEPDLTLRGIACARFE